jgi:hypothetical protein
MRTEDREHLNKVVSNEVFLGSRPFEDGVGIQPFGDCPLSPPSGADGGGTESPKRWILTTY